MIYAQVIVNLSVKSLDRPFTYIIPEELKHSVSIASSVKIPFGKQTLDGFVIDILESLPQSLKDIEIKNIISVTQISQIWQKEILSIALWMKSYYGCTLIEALKSALPSDISIQKPLVQGFIHIRPDIDLDKAQEDLKHTPARFTFLKELVSKKQGCIKILKRFKAEYLKTLEDKGFLTIVYETEKKVPLKNRVNTELSKPNLTTEQIDVLEKIDNLISTSKPSVMLLHGVTGSGKTEVYMSAIENVIKMGKTAIVLIPEISLTPQYADRFRGRFGDIVAIIHSGFSKVQRNYEWNRLFSGEAKIALGARSAIFAPISNIGIIIVDEEHEIAYKQESQPRYHARHIAIKRSQANNSLLILGSATPSLESYFHAINKRYAFASMFKRVKGTMPEIKVVDMRKSFNRDSGGFLSPYLIKEIQKKLKENKQTILFINRRGFFNYIYCEDCGYIIRCPNCDIAMRFHTNPNILKCHYCSHSSIPNDICPKCSGFNMSHKGGGTQRIELEVSKLFPEAKIARMDRDSLKKKGASEKIYDSFASGDADILIGTQTVAKGLDFPNVALVGVVLADVSFSMPDFRSSERAYQLLLQVGGRAGRGYEDSKFVIQTYNPEHPAIEAIVKNKASSFYKQELAARKELFYPPYVHMIRIVFTGEDLPALERVASDFTSNFKKEDNDIVVGPSPCPLLKVNNRFRWQLHIRTKNVIKTISKIKIITENCLKNLLVSIDVDSYSFL